MPQQRALIANEAPVSLTPLMPEIPSPKYFGSCFLAAATVLVNPAKAEIPATVLRNTAAAEMAVILLKY